MAGPNFVLDKGFAAGAAMEQFRVVKFNGSDATSVIKTSTLGDPCVGVVQEGDVTAGDATNGRLVNVRMIGISRITAGAAITLGALVRADAAGKVVPLAATTANQNVVGKALGAASGDGDQIEVLLMVGSQAST